MKPYYSSIDLTEVELEDKEDAVPRGKTEFDKLKHIMINRQVSWQTIPVKLHLDKMVIKLNNNLNLLKIINFHSSFTETCRQ